MSIYPIKRTSHYQIIEIRGAHLKPCPFCDGRPRLLESPSDPEEGPGPGYYYYTVTCDCGARGKSIPFEKEDAIKHWNARPLKS